MSEQENEQKTKQKGAQAKLFTDGGSRGNPGEAGLGFVLEGVGESEALCLQGGWYLPHATNNVAEYSALIWGLQNSLDAGVEKLAVYADSELMVKQMNGLYKVKSKGLLPLFKKAQSLFLRFDAVTIEHVYRTENTDADHLANAAMDRRSSVGDYRLPWDTLSDSLFSGEDFGQDSGDGKAGGGNGKMRREEGGQTGRGEATSTIEHNPDTAGGSTLTGKTYREYGGSYELTVRDHFDAAHTLPGYDGPCRYLHGHTWDVELTVEGEELDEVGIVYDFKDIKRDLKGILDNFDHKYLNDVPPFDRLNPTAEHLARVIFHELSRHLPQHITLKEVAVWESPTAKLVYRPR